MKAFPRVLLSVNAFIDRYHFVGRPSLNVATDLGFIISPFQLLGRVKTKDYYTQRDLKKRISTRCSGWTVSLGTMDAV